MRSNQGTNGFVIEEVDDETAENLETKSTNTTYTPIYQPVTSAVAIYDEDMAAKQQKMFQSSIKQQTKTIDDSNTAYGERYAKSFGDKQFIPMPEPSAPPLEDADWQEYQAWMHAPTFADRTDKNKFPNYARWHGILNQGVNKFHLTTTDVLNDVMSAQFRAQVKSGQHPKLLQGQGRLPRYQDLNLYQPQQFQAQKISEEKEGYFDQVQLMMDYADEQYKVSYAKGKLTGQEIKSNMFYVVSDHNGKSSGTKLQIWGAGTKQGFGMASMSSTTSLNIVEGSDASGYSNTADYIHVPNRFTIIRIQDNEVGFVFERGTNIIQMMKLGRYVINERDYAYVGKAILQNSNAPLPLTVHRENKDANITQLAQRLQILMVTVGKVAFATDNMNTYMLPAREAPYVLDQRRGERFINFAETNQQLIRASDNSYTTINQLQPGQFAVFQYNSQVIIWEHDADNPVFNTLFLPANQFEFGGIHSVNDNRLTWKNVDIINLRPGQVLSIRDRQQQVRFIEEPQPKMFVLRSPWQFVGLLGQNQVSFHAGSKEQGNEVVRLMLRSSEWAAVIDNTGHLAFYPPRLDNQPYYFSQPEHTVIEVINKNKVGETKLKDVPGIGEVSIVNIPSGNIGACRIRNMHFLLNPSDVPYVFVSPDAFLEMVNAEEPHYKKGDLHRIVLKPDERAVISKDGKLYRIPEEKAADNMALSEENGVYVFRSLQFEIYGPKKKSEKKYTLGPIQYFNVGVGEVAYGTQNGKLKIWLQGEHSVDNRLNEWFTDFFSTNVDPVEIDNLSVTFKHGITGSVGVYVSYHIVDSEKAIRQFKDHGTLHQFIEETTRSEMLNLCASRPPLGYTEAYFTTDEKRRNIESGMADVSKDASEIQSSFMQHTSELLDQYGVQISKMYTKKWTLADDFVKQVQTNAKVLQDAHAKVEQMRMQLQQKNLENEQEIQRKRAEIELKKHENERLQLELDAAQIRQTNETQSKAAAEIITAKAKAQVAEQDAMGKAAAAAAESKMHAQLSIIQAETQAKIAEQEALGKTAAQRIETERALKNAENELDIQRKQNEIEQLKNATAKQRGEIDAENASKMTISKYAGLSDDARTRIQLAEISASNMRMLLEFSVKSGVQIPGVMTMDPQILQLMQMPAIAASTMQASRSFNTPVVMFPPALPSITESKSSEPARNVLN